MLPITQITQTLITNNGGKMSKVDLNRYADFVKTVCSEPAARKYFKNIKAV